MAIFDRIAAGGGLTAAIGEARKLVQFPPYAAACFPVLRTLPEEEQNRLFFQWLRTNPLERGRRPRGALTALSLMVLLWIVTIGVGSWVGLHVLRTYSGILVYVLLGLIVYVAARLVFGPIHRIAWRPYDEGFQTFLARHGPPQNWDEGSSRA